MNNKGIIACIFDFSFSEFVTTRIIKILFILAILLAGLWALIILGAGFASKDAGTIFGSLIMAPLVFFFAVLWSRVWLELIVVAFRIAENTARLVEQGRASSQQQNP